ncbi:MAG: hypothetical protein L6R28_21900 [Planctomycetes bacterium]|nr:hypothetical protein [Planctomycetota bacterium]
MSDLRSPSLAWGCIILAAALALCPPHHAEAAQAPADPADPAKPAAEAQNPVTDAAFKKLLEGLRAEDEAAARTAEDALVKLPKERTPALRAALLAEKELLVAGRLARVLSRRGERFDGLNDMPRVLQDELKTRCGTLVACPATELPAAIRKVLEYGGASEPLLAPMLQAKGGKDAVRLRSALVLARLAREDALPELVRGLGNDETLMAVRAALLAWKEMAAAVLRTRGLKAEEPLVRQRSAELLGWMGAAQGGKDVESDLLKLNKDRSEDVALNGTVAVANLRVPKSFAALLDELKQVPKKDRFRLHATAVALASTAKQADLEKIAALLKHREAVYREAGLVALGLWQPPPQSKGDALARAEAVRPLLDDGAKEIQRRACETLGALAEAGDKSALKLAEPLAKALQTGVKEVRYAAALALGELAAHEVELPEAGVKACREMLGVEDIKLASGACTTALMSVIEPSTGGGDVTTGVGGGSPGIPRPQLPGDTPRPTKPGDDDGSDPKDPPKKDPDPPKDPPKKDPPPPANDGYYNEGFKFKEEHKPVTDAKNYDPTQKNDAPKDGGTPGTTPAPTPPKRTAPDSSEANDEYSTPGSSHGLIRKRSSVPPSLPGLKRHELQEIDNPARPGDRVFAGYVRVN